MSEYFKGVKAEWKKIIWPNKKELTKKTSAVLITSIFLGALIGIMDVVFQNGVNLITGLF